METKKHTLREISAETPILFTTKSFFALIGTILAIFFGFYMLVVTPKLDSVDKNYSDVRTEVDGQNKFIYDEFKAINTSLQEMKNSIDNIALMESNAIMKRDKMGEQIIKNSKLLKKNTTSTDTIKSHYDLPYMPLRENNELTQSNKRITH